MKMQKVKLGDICKLVNGFAFQSENYVSNGLRIIRIANVQKGYIEDNTPCYYPLSMENQLSKYKLYENDLLISLTGNVGRVALVNKKLLPAVLNQRVACLRVNNDKLIDKQYLFALLNSDFFETKCIRAANGVAQKNLSTEWLKNFEIPLPSIEDQKEISERLDKVSELIDKRKEQIKKLDLLIKSRFIEMFGECKNKVKLSEICNIITDGTHQSPKFESQGVPFLFVSNIVDNTINYETTKYISQKNYEELIKRTPIEKGDVLLSTVGSYGHPAVVVEDKPFCFQRHIAYLKPNNNEILSYYLYGAILSENVQKQIEDKVKGIAQKTLNLSEIRTIIIPLPILQQQFKYVNFIKNTNLLKIKLLQDLDKLEVLKTSLMQQYFG